MNKWTLSIIILIVILVPILESSSKQITIQLPSGDHVRGLKSVIEWYVPTNLDVDLGDTITWVNDDISGHTITSGKGIGFLGNPDTDKAQPDGNFDSGIISTGKSWSYTFKEKGFFSYTCTIHPWIERSITVLEPGLDISKDIRISYGLITTIVIILAIIGIVTIIIKIRQKRREKSL